MKLSINPFCVGLHDITQSFNQSVPVEEQLRLLLQTPPGTLPPVALQSQVETALKQLIARYALTEQPAPKK